MILEPFLGRTLRAFEFAQLAFDIADTLSANQVYLRPDWLAAPGRRSHREPGNR